MNKTPNNSIKCSVNSCAYHCGEQNYCTLNEIKVGCCDSNVTNCASTECASFQLGDHGGCCQALNRPSMQNRAFPVGNAPIFMVFTPWARQAPRP